MRKLSAVLIAAILAIACVEREAPQTPEALAPLAAGSAAAKPSSQPMTVRPVDAPFLAKANVPFIAADGEGGFFVSYVDEQKRTLAMTSYRDGKWSAPVSIATGDLLVNRADTPALAASGRTVAASWSTKHGHGRTIHLARSTDGGATWSAAVTPHPQKISEFGFVALTPAMEAVWLDGRDLPGGMEGAGDMQLRGPEDALLDARVCDCCQTSIATTSEGPIVAYRDRSDGEVRDIAVVRRTAQGWSSPAVVHADGWTIAGCPVNGPQIDASGDRVAVAWFTAANDDPRVQLAFSTDAGKTFGAPVRVDGGKGGGRVDVAFLEDGSAVVTWVELGSAQARRVLADGTAGAPVTLGPATGFPRLAVSKQNVAVVWSSEDGPKFALLERL